jgi:glycosyltransferase involved in cell wall biosynthesis
VSLAHEFTERGWRVRTVFAGGSDASSLLDWCRDQGVEAETHPAVLRLIDSRRFQDLIALRQLVIESKPTVVNLHFGGNSISLRDVVAVRLAGLQRCIVTVHHPEPWSELDGRRRLLTRIAARLCSRVVVPSHATRDVLLQAGVPLEKIQVIFNGVRAPNSLPTRQSARNTLGLPQDAFVVSTLARLEPHKGIQDLIEALARISDPQEQLRLVVAGEGPLHRDLEALAVSRLGTRGVFLGRVRDTADVYAASDVFALPSHMEGFGLVYIEAAFQGVPSIGTKVGGIPDAIADGETGLLVRPKDPEALAAAITQMRDHPEQRMLFGAAARARAAAEFTTRHMANAYERVYSL